MFVSVTYAILITRGSGNHGLQSYWTPTETQKLPPQLQTIPPSVMPGNALRAYFAKILQKNNHAVLTLTPRYPRQIKEARPTNAFQVFINSIALEIDRRVTEMRNCLIYRQLEIQCPGKGTNNQKKYSTQTKVPHSYHVA